MRICLGGLGAFAAVVLVACNGGGGPASPSAGATVRFDYRAPTAVSPDLPPSTQSCVNGVGRTHIHPSWRNFTRIDMQAEGSQLWHITFTDVPIDERLSCAVALIDRLTHHAEIVVIEGDSYRKREAELSQKQRRTKTRTRR